MILSQENWNSLQKDILICVKLICLLLVSLPVLAFLIWTLRTAFPSYIVLSQSVVSSFSKSINSSLTYIIPSFLKQSLYFWHHSFLAFFLLYRLLILLFSFLIWNLFYLYSSFRWHLLFSVTSYTIYMLFFSSSSLLSSWKYILLL